MSKLIIPLENLSPSIPKPKQHDSIIYENGTIGAIGSVTSTSVVVLPLNISLKGPKGDKGDKGDPGTIDLTKVVTLSDTQNISGEKTFSTAPKTSKEYTTSEDIFDLSKYESGESSKNAFMLMLALGLPEKFKTSDDEIPSMKSVAQMIGGILSAGLGCKLISDIAYETCTEEELQEAINNSD